MCLDSAVGEWGTAVDNAVEASVHGSKSQGEARAKAENTLRFWLDMPRQYRDPVAAGKVQLPTKSEED